MMKSNKLHLMTAILYLIAGVCFLFATGLHTEMPSKVLSGIAAVCFLIGSMGFFCTWLKGKRLDK